MQEESVRCPSAPGPASQAASPQLIYWQEGAPIPELLAEAARRARMILIDGQSGAGKTALAAALAATIHLPLLHIESWYPGWSGLAEGTRVLQEMLAGQRTSYTKWDWHSGQAAEPVPVDLRTPHIIEGCGTITARTVNAMSGTLPIWVDAPAAKRRARAAAREASHSATGAATRETQEIPWWEMWEKQEAAHIVAHNPCGLAQILVHTAAE